MIIRSAEHEFQALLDVAVDAVVIIDHCGVIKNFNRAAEELFGYAAREMIGANVSLLIPEPHGSQHDDYIRRYLTDGVSHIIGIGREVEARRKDGSLVPVSLAVGRVPNTDPPRFVGFMHDITLRREALESAQRERDRTKKYAEDELRMQQRLEQVSRFATLGEMAAGIAHELNQPLAAITNYAVACERLLQAPARDLAEVQGALREIGAQALRAGEIIRRLRHLVRAREINREPLDLNDLVTELLPLAQSDARQNNVSLAFEPGRNVPPVDVDGVQIQQMLLNLTRNAVEALASCHHGERTVIVRTACNERGEVEVSVSDSGPGVDPAIEERMFEPFCTTKKHGTGLGLTISKSIVEAHRGRLDYRPSETGAPGAPTGACFVVTLPHYTEEEES